MTQEHNTTGVLTRRNLVLKLKSEPTEAISGLKVVAKVLSKAEQGFQSVTHVMFKGGLSALKQGHRTQKNMASHRSRPPVR